MLRKSQPGMTLRAILLVHGTLFALACGSGDGVGPVANDAASPMGTRSDSGAWGKGGGGGDSSATRPGTGGSAKGGLGGEAASTGGSAGLGGSSGTAGSATGGAAATELPWRKANLTNYESYPDPGSEECTEYNGCQWAGQFAALDGVQPEAWVKANNIIAVHEKDFEQYKLKTLRLRMGTKQIDAKVYDMCSDADCDGCCTKNSAQTGFLIDIEANTMNRFGAGDGIVEWACLDCASSSARGDSGTSAMGGPITGACTPGSGATPTQQTLVFVRHAQTLENVCQDECSDNTCCRSDVCAQGCNNDCSCTENVTTFSSSGWAAVGDALVNRLKKLDLKWDKVIVSPTWRTQTTIKAYLEAESLCGEIVPEIDECWNEESGSCSTPPWDSEQYTMIDFAGGAQRLTPRTYNGAWDPSPTLGGRVLYDHSKAALECENVIMDRGYEYIEKLFANGAKAVLVVTHSMTGAGLLQRLTGTSKYDLENAPAYTVLKRATQTGNWNVAISNGT